MHKKILLGTVTLLALLSTTAHAGNGDEGWYLSIAGGINDTDTDDIQNGATRQQVTYDYGYAAKGAFGYQHSDGLRSEIELSYRNNDLDTISSIVASGDASTYSAMLNMIYDFDISDTGLDTFIGIGAGLAHVDLNNVSPVAGASLLDDGVTTPALQAIFGVSYDVADSTELYAQYHYFHAMNPDYRDATGTIYKLDYNSNAIMLGLKFDLFDHKVKVPHKHESTRYIEATQQPIREKAPEPEPVVEKISRTYLVFFDFDKHQLTQEAASILRQAALDAKEGQAVAVEVVGHADRAGSDDYNMDLSQRRATTVYMALQQLGIPTEYIEALARGETDPLIPTDDGVREPQNRRVEITYMISPE